MQAETALALLERAETADAEPELVAGLRALARAPATVALIRPTGLADPLLRGGQPPRAVTMFITVRICGPSLVA